MEAIIFCGIQATGKSTFYQANFFMTHVRISMDLLRTRHREQLFLDACFTSSQCFVVDNTNPSKIDRERYITAAKAYGYKVKGYYFQSKLTEAIVRNAQRSGRAQVPDAGVRGTYGRLELPSLSEGFDELYYVAMKENGFDIKIWQDEV